MKFNTWFSKDHLFLYSLRACESMLLSGNCLRPKNYLLNVFYILLSRINIQCFTTCLEFSLFQKELCLEHTTDLPLIKVQLGQNNLKGSGKIKVRILLLAFTP